MFFLLSPSTSKIDHSPYKKYNEHWKDPSQTNLIWLGLLFAILNINMLAYHQHSTHHHPYQGRAEPLFHLYRTRTAQCLLSGDMAKCLPYTIEALRLNATAELNRRDDNRRGLWLTTGVLLRAAINMGYHRDPSSLSLLQAEYRRRTWLAVVSMDNMASFMGGFPPSADCYGADTAEPRNLHEWELTADAKEEELLLLPPSRPLTEQTAVTYLIVKGRLSAALRCVTELQQRSGRRPAAAVYDRVVDVDGMLYEAYANFPPQMKVEEEGTTTTMTQIKPTAAWRNMSLFCMYHMGMLTLHRRFVTVGITTTTTTDGCRLSRERCVVSALALLAFQKRAFEKPELHARAQMREVLALAAMVLCLELEVRRKKVVPSTSSVVVDDKTILQALRDSCECWAKVAETLEDARRVHRLLVGMVESGGGAGKEQPVSSHTMSPPQVLPDDGGFLGAEGFSLVAEDDMMDFNWVRSVMFSCFPPSV